MEINDSNAEQSDDHGQDQIFEDRPLSQFEPYTTDPQAVLDHISIIAYRAIRTYDELALNQPHYLIEALRVITKRARVCLVLTEFSACFIFTVFSIYKVEGCL